MRIGRLVLPVLFVLVTAVPSWTQESARTGTGISAPKNKSNVAEQLSTAAETENLNLTMAAALGLALTRNPSLAAFAEEIRARDAAALQAGLLPNPDLVVESENFAGQGELKGFSAAENTLALSQLVELGGKRDKRRQVAALGTNLAEWDYQSQKLDVLAATAKAFIQVLAAQQQQVQTEELVGLSEQTLSAVSARVEAGKVPPLEKIRAQVERASARTAASKARRQLFAARSRLAAFWGAKQLAQQQAVGDLTSIRPIPDIEALFPLLKNNPDLARGVSEIERGRAAVSLARAQSVPDLTLNLGVRNLQETDNNALVAGIEMPLQFFDRNQGGIGEAKAILEKTRRERWAAETRIRTGLSVAWQSLAASHAEAITLRDEILPGARSAFDAAEFGYREGKFDFLQLLDSQRTLFEIKGQSLQALASYHLARIEVDRLIGAPQHNLLQPATNRNPDKR